MGSEGSHHPVRGTITRFVFWKCLLWLSHNALLSLQGLRAKLGPQGLREHRAPRAPPGLQDLRARMD